MRLVVKVVDMSLREVSVVCHWVLFPLLQLLCFVRESCTASVSVTSTFLRGTLLRHMALMLQLLANDCLDEMSKSVIMEHRATARYHARTCRRPLLWVFSTSFRRRHEGHKRHQGLFVDAPEISLGVPNLFQIACG